MNTIYHLFDNRESCVNPLSFHSSLMLANLDVSH